MKHNEFFLLSLGVFLTIVAWMLSDFYHTSMSAKMKVNPQLPNAVNYEINIKTLEELKLRQP